MKNLKPLTVIVVIVIIIILFLIMIPIVFWFNNPELTQMQMVIKFWPLYLVDVALALIIRILIDKL